MPTAILGGCCSREMPGRACKEMQVIEREGDIAITRQLDRLAHILRLQLGQFLSVLAQQRRQLFQRSGTRTMRQLGPAPILESLTRRRDGTIHVLQRAFRNLCNRFAGGRVNIRNRLARTTIDEFTIDEKFVFGHTHRPFRQSEITKLARLLTLSRAIRTSLLKEPRIQHSQVRRQSLFYHSGKEIVRENMNTNRASARDRPDGIVPFSDVNGSRLECGNTNVQRAQSLPPAYYTAPVLEKTSRLERILQGRDSRDG